VKFIRSISDRYLLGNHEEKQIRWERHEKKRRESGKKNPMKHVEDYQGLADGVLSWLKNHAELFLTIEAGGKKFLLVHGGIEPRMRSLPKTSKPFELSRKEKSYAWNVLRTRYVNPRGHMVMLGEETSEDRYWPEVYDGRFGHVIFGHQPFLDRPSPVEYEHATAIDLGCVYGSYLCAYIIDGETGETSYLSVKAKDKYAIHRIETGSKKRVPW